jgi:hypothetical protein
MAEARAMRDLTVAAAAMTGAWLMAHASAGWGAVGLSGLGGQSPLGLLSLLPSIFIGALLGAVVGSLFRPFRS